MMTIPTANQLINHDRDADKALLLFYENAYPPLLDHMNLLNDEYQHASGDSVTEAEDFF